MSERPWEKYTGQIAKNPVAPAGLQQQAKDVGQYQARNDGNLPPWLNGDYSNNTRPWFSGGNQQGTNNGWDISGGFVDTMQREYDEATGTQGGLGKYYDFEGSGTTGIATFDYKPEGTDREYTFGDIYEGGKKVGNLYDEDSGFTRDTANLLMARFLLDRPTQNAIFTSNDREARLDKELQSIREKANVEFPQAFKAQETAGKVEERQEQFQEQYLEGYADEVAATAAGAAGGAAIGAGIGSFFPGAGTAIGGAVGGVVGGVGGFMNRDEISQAAARASVVTGMAEEDFGAIRALFTGAQQWAGVAGKTMMPLSNITRGAYDAAAGSQGDGTEEFHELDAAGDRKAPGWVIGADLAGSVGDSLLTFASPIGRGLFTAQMGTNIAGATGQLATTGSSFDDRRGEFDNVFFDDEGNFDPVSGAAGIGTIGIDVVQLGMARGLAGSASAARANAKIAEPATGIVGRAQAGWGNLVGRAEKAVPYRFGGTKGLEEGQDIVRLGATKVIVDKATGKAVEGSRRMTLSMLAPSEALPYVSANMMARRAAVRDAAGPRAVSTDDYYKAATSLANGERKVTSAFLNAFGEASEEAAQSILEPLSHNGAVDPWEMIESAAYGGAMGLGMSLGTGLHSPSADQRLRAQANSRAVLTFGQEISDEQWAQMSQAEKQAAAAMDTKTKEIAERVFDRIKDEQATTLSAGVPDLARLQDAQLAAQESALEKISTKTDGAFVIGQLESAGEVDADGNLRPDSMPNNAVGSSHRLVATNLREHQRGLRIQRETLQREIAELQDKAAKGQATEQDQERLDGYTRQLTTTELTIEMAELLTNEAGTGEVDQMVAEISAHIEADDRAAALGTVRELNQVLQAAYDRRLPNLPNREGALTEEERNAMARAATLVFVREPKDQSGSFLSMVPQANFQLSWTNSDHFAQVSHSVLTAIGGDYDGDKIRQQAQLIIDDQAFENSRSGSGLMGVGTGPMIGTRDYETYNVANMAQAMAMGGMAADLATHTIRSISRAISRRYTGLVPAPVLDAALMRFADDVASNTPKARQRLIDFLAERGGDGIMRRARGDLSNEWLWIDQVVVANMQEFQTGFALYQPRETVEPDTTVEEPHKMRATSTMAKRMKRQAATLGQTLGQWTDGPGQFRAFQKLHYSVLNAAVTTAEDRQDQIVQLASLYEALGRRVTQSELMEVRAKDDITGRVVLWLNQLAAEAKRDYPGLDVSTAPVMLASIQAQDFERLPDGSVRELPGKISLAQLLLKRSVEMDQQEKAKVLDRDTQLQAKHSRLLAMTRPGSKDNPVNAERALLEVFGSQPLYALLGSDATPLGMHLTPDQFLRRLESMHEKTRQQEVRALQNDPSYLSIKKNKGTRSLPYSIDEVAEGATSYRVVVDALVNVGRYELTADANGKVSGTKADTDHTTSKNLHKAHRQIKAALVAFKSYSPRDNETDVEAVRRMFAENPDQGRVLLQLIPKDAIQAVFYTDHDGNQVMAPWFYEAFAEQDARKAEMMYWRGLLMAQWNALGGRGYVEKTDVEGVQGRKFSALERRMLRVMYRLSASNNATAYLEFLDELYRADDLEVFMRKVNRNPSWRGDQAPLLAWVDDTADFDPDKAGGGWGKTLPASELRAAIADLKDSTERLIQDLKDEERLLAEDQQVFIELDRFGTSEETPASRELHAKMQASIDLAGSRMQAVGPGAMVMQGVASLLGFYPSAHTKGQNPSVYRPFGLFDAQRDAYGFTTSYERYQAGLTAVNLEDVSGNPAMLLRGNVTSMDSDGNVVQWEKPSVEKMTEMLRNPETRSLARAMLFPTVTEATADGYVATKFLTGKSVTALLDSTMHRELYNVDSNGRLTHGAAMLYGTAVNAGARRHGGTSSDFVRAVNDLVVARTTSLQKPLSAEAADRMWNEAAREVAELLQMAGSIRSEERLPAGASGPERESKLTQIRDAVRQAARSQQAQLSLGITGEDGKILTEWSLDQFVAERKEQMAQRVGELTRNVTAATSASDQAAIARQVAAEQAAMQRLEEKVELLRTNDQFGAIASRYAIRLDGAGNPTAESLAAQREILAYIHSTGFSLMNRVPKVQKTLIKLSGQLSDKLQAGTPDLTGAEWQELSGALIAVKLDDLTSIAPPSLALPVYPDEAKDYERRYYDPSWSYLVENLLTPGNPLLEEAADLHEQAGRLGVTTEQTQLIRYIGDVVLDDRRLGPWTTDIPRASITANERLDSASAEPAISMSGNAPKRQVTISSATRRSFRNPGDDLLSTATLSYATLNSGKLDRAVLLDLAIEGQPAVRTSMPLAQLNNRFAKTAILRYVDASGARQEVDLMDLQQMAEVGVTWAGDASVAASDYRVVTVERLAHAVDYFMANVEPNGRVSGIDVALFHPDSQPAGPQWMRNVYFEGTSFATVGDDMSSLNNTLWFSPGGQSPQLQAAALDAAKLGLPALKVVPPPTAEARAAAEAGWTVDFATMLKAKTQLMMSQDYGAGVLDPHLYNAVYMNMKIRHYVRGTIDGAPVLWTAEQVIAHQLATGTDIGTVIEDAELYTPSDNVLREMFGEPYTQGTDAYHDTFVPNPAAIPRFEGVNAAQAAQYGGSGTVALETTNVVARGRQTQLSVNSHISQATLNAYDMRIQRHNAMRRPIYEDRSQMIQHGTGGFNPSLNIEKMVKRAGDAMRKSNVSFDWVRLGMPWIGPSTASPAMAELMFRQLGEAKKADGDRTGWIYEHNATSKPTKGLLSNVDLGANDSRPGLTVAPQDPVLIITSSFQGDRDKVREVVDHFVGRGADIILVSEDGGTEERTLAAVHLQEAHGYEPIPGARDAYGPPEFQERYQTVRARESLLTETGPATLQNRLLVLLVDGEAITENSAYMVPKADERMQFRNVGVGLNLVPTDFLVDMNVPRGAQVDPVKATVLQMLESDQGREHLLRMAGAEDLPPTHVGYTLDEAMDRLVSRLRSNAGTVLPEPGDSFGTGDLIPLIDGNNNILFYRHGYKAPKNRDKVIGMWRQGYEGEVEGRGVAIFPSESEPNSTNHTGTVARFFERPGYGLAAELHVPLQQFGDKLQLEWQGMKYVVSTMPASYDLPEHGILGDLGPDLVADRDSSDSKEAFGERLDNFRNAFAFLGVDFSRDLQDFFGVDSANLRTLLTNIQENAERIPVRLAHEMLTSTFVEPALVQALTGLDGELNGAMQSETWLDSLGDDSYQSTIAYAAMVYLMTPGAKVEHILQSGGFNDPNATNSDYASRLMPSLFTQVFDRAPVGTPLRNEMFARLNRQLNNPNTDDTGWVLLPDWRLQITTRDEQGRLRTKYATLQIPEVHSSGDNPIKNGMAFSEDDSQAAGWHSQSITWAAYGAETAHSKTFSTQGYLDQPGIYRFTGGNGDTWKMLTETAAPDNNFEAWRMPSPLEIERRAMAYEAVVGFRQELDLAEWDRDAKGASRRREYEEARDKIRTELGLPKSLESMIDFWVRQQLGRPAGLVENEAGQITDAPNISANDAIDAANNILWNVENNFLPTMGAEVPLMHLIDLQTLFRADSKWALRSNLRGPVELMDRDWNAWLETALGTALIENTDVFDPMFLLATDGMMHTYQGANTSLLNLPVSIDMQRNQQLMDPNTNQLFVSLNKDINLLASEPVVLDTQQASLRQLMGGERINGRYVSRTAPAAAATKRRKARARWRYETNTPLPVEGTVGDLRTHGARFVHKSQQTALFYRMLINLRVGTALINPALWLSAGPESWFRQIMDNGVNALTMGGTTGKVAATQARIAERGQRKAAERVEAGSESQIQAQGGLVTALTGGTRYSRAQQNELEELYRTLGSRVDFGSMISNETYYLNTKHQNAGFFERASEKYAKLGASFQDPTMGARSRTVAKRYMEGALRYILAQPTTRIVSVEALAAGMRTDPRWLQKHMPEAHQAGVNSVAYFRSLNNTLPNKIARGIYEPLSTYDNGAVQAFGNLFLRIPLLFSGYAASVALNLTGMQGFFDAASMTLDSRTGKGMQVIGRFSAKLNQQKFNPDTWTGFDMSDVLDGVDLAQSFLRSGATLTGLAMMGMVMGGLTGEDEEMKRRRRQAEIEGAPVIYDPRELVNNIANEGAIFIDGLPVLGDILSGLYEVGGEDEENRRAIAHLPWVLKAFVSPVLGVAQFLQTGDPRQVRWGFEDALASFPLLNRFMYQEVVNTYEDLMQGAAEQAEKGTPEGDLSAMKLIIGGIAAYENMLFENSFLNATYVAVDRYDRDPYKPVEVTDTGEARQEKTPTGSEPYASTGLEDYLDENGQLRQGYLGRDYAGRAYRQLSESRATLAVLGSVLSGSGLGGDTIRYNMPRKIKNFEAPEISAKEARAAVAYFATQEQGLPQFLTAEELVPIIKAEYRARGEWYDEANVETEAKQRAKALQEQALAAYSAGQSFAGAISPKQGAVLSNPEAPAVLQGLTMGTIQLGDPAMRGFYITLEDREKIQEAWQIDLIQEGVDYGLTETQARYRMYRIWNGDGADKGIKDILWSDQIGYSNQAQYAQLNTTFTSGPDGMPVATGATRGGLLAGFGVVPMWQWGSAAQGGVKEMGGALGLDSVLNVQDFALGLNTGARALEPVKSENRIPGDPEILKAIEDVEKRLSEMDFTASSPYNSTAKGGYGRGSWGRYGGYGRRGGYGGYGGYSGGSAYYSRLDRLPEGRVPYGNTVPFINTSNPIIRRSQIRRERVTSERGRLNQWQ